MEKQGDKSKFCKKNRIIDMKTEADGTVSFLKSNQLFADA